MRKAIKMEGYSLHIGVDRVDQEMYPYWVPPLTTAENDAMVMADLTRSKGFKNDNIRLLLSEKATRNAFHQAIIEIAKLVKDGDLFVLTFSGHGSKIDDLDGDEEFDGQDETLCMYDGIVVDDELKSWMQNFKKDIRIVVIIDCCYSEGIIKDLFQKFQTKSQNENLVNALFIGISSSREYQITAGRNGKHGRFTANFVELFKNANGNITYNKLFRSIHKRMDCTQKPTYSHLKDGMGEEIVFQINPISPHHTDILLLNFKSSLMSNFEPEVKLLKTTTYKLVVVSPIEDKRFISDGFDDITTQTNDNGDFDLRVRVKLGNQQLKPSPVTHVVELGEFPFQSTQQKIQVAVLEGNEIKGNGAVSVAQAEDEPRFTGDQQ